MNFNNLDSQTVRTIVEMWAEFSDYSELQIVEVVADEMGLPDSEEAVTVLFNESVLPYIDKNDEPMVREAFSAFVDTLERDGTLHEIQAESYCWLGEDWS